MLQSQDLKQYLHEAGVDLCGVANVERFTAAPAGFHPLDVLPECRSVVALAKRFPHSTLHCPETTVPYTIARNMLSDWLEKLCWQTCIWLEDQGFLAVPTGVIGPTEHDLQTGRDRNIVSAKHSAELAGLGRIGKNTLLVTPEYGNLVWLAVLLTDAALQPDPLISESYCPEHCHICEKACPVQAIDGPELKQETCYEFAFGGENGGDWKIKCNRCRTLCPLCRGPLRGA